MDEASHEVDRPASELADSPVRWEIPKEEIEGMTEEQLRAAVVELNEKVRRLYEVAMLTVHSHETGQPVKPEDINDLLNS